MYTYAQIGDTVRVRLHEFAESGAGCQTSIQVDGGSVFAPFSRFPLLTPGGRTKSPQVSEASRIGRNITSVFAPLRMSMASQHPAILKVFLRQCTFQEISQHGKRTVLQVAALAL